MAQAPLTLRRWKRTEYERLVALGVFHGEPIELIGGQLVVAEPQYPYHASAISAADYALRAVLPPGWIVRVQAPVSLDDESEPEPDVAVVPGSVDDYRSAHPSRPALIIEVSESSLGSDRERKGSVYARAGLRDYWILNLEEGVLEVYREPAADPSALFGWRYARRQVFNASARVSPLAAPDASIRVGDLLP